MKLTKKKPAAAKKPARRKKADGAKVGARKRSKPPAAQARPAPVENPEAQRLARKIGALLLDKKALDVAILDVRGIASYADYVVLASGESDRQVTAMADHVHAKLKAEDSRAPLGSEGFETGQWVLLDYGEVVVHLFFAEARAHYDLEGLWADAAKETVA
jgi:ribosome-associated protein